MSVSILDGISYAALTLGAFFFFAGTVGMLRFPNVYARLHALTKCDNLGFGLVVFGLAWQAESWFVVAKLFLIWGLVMLAGTTNCHLIAQSALAGGIEFEGSDRG